MIRKLPEVESVHPLTSLVRSHQTDRADGAHELLIPADKVAIVGEMMFKLA